MNCNTTHYRANSSSVPGDPTKVAERSEQQAVLRQQIVDDDAELQQEPELRRRQEDLETEVARLDQRLELCQAQAEALRERLNRLGAAERDLREQERRSREARERASRQRQLLATARSALEEAQAIVARQDEIETSYALIVARRGELERFTAAQAEFNRLCRDLAQFESAVAEARGKLEGRRHQLAEQVRALCSQSGERERLGRELEAARLEAAQLDQQESKRAEIDTKLVETRERYAEIRAHVQQAEQRLVEVAERRVLLGASPSCPICRTALSPDHHRRVLGQYQQDESDLASLRDRHQRELEGLGAVGKSYRAELEKLQAIVAARRESQTRIAKLERALTHASEQLEHLQKTRAELEGVEQLLEKCDYAPVERRELLLVRKQIEVLDYDAAAHKAASDALASLAPYEPLHQQLQEARRRVERERQAAEVAGQALAEWEAEAAAAEERLAELKSLTAELPTAQREMVETESALRELRRSHVELNRDLGAVRQHLLTMEFTARRRKERLAELDLVHRERSIYQELVEAFGRNGLQVMLIETAIPEIQDEANRLLALMTDGRMRVSFETHRTNQSGGTVETLDIIISDELGSRAYELYSGGEAFRVNFAIRIALSKLLARRAGARLQLLVVDEGFGSQDEQGRERIVEAIKTIRDEFEKILVITHLPDLRDLFDVRIDVSKTPAGSVIELN